MRCQNLSCASLLHAASLGLTRIAGALLAGHAESERESSGTGSWRQPRKQSELIEKRGSHALPGRKGLVNWR